MKEFNSRKRMQHQNNVSENVENKRGAVKLLLGTLHAGEEIEPGTLHSK